VAFGLIDTSYIDFPPNLDGTYLRGLQLRSGLSFAQLAGRLDQSLARLNAGVDDLLASLLAPATTSVTAQGNPLGTMKAEWKSQFTVIRPQLVEAAATMLAINELEIGIGFTEDGIQEISLDNFGVQCDAAAGAMQRAARGATLVRFFSAAEMPVADGTAATSPGFAGSGTGGNVFGGTFPDGTPVPGGYSLYYRDTAANRAAIVMTARNELRRWHPAPYDLVGSAAFVSALALDAHFVYAGSPLIRAAAGTSEAVVDPTVFLGVFDGDVRVHQPINDFADDNCAVYKTYGDYAPANPLVWRYDPLRGLDAYVRSREMFPLAEAVGMRKFGPNVWNRVGAALIAIRASGGYVPPSIGW